MESLVTPKTHQHTKKELLGGRTSTSIIFFALGSMGGAWLGRLPDVKQHLGLSTSVLGTILLVGAFSGLSAMQLAPMLLRRFGHRAVLGTLAVIYPFVLLLIPLARNAVQLGAALVLWGSLGSLLGVVVNTHAVDVEKAYQRAILSSFHAMYSIGTMIGAGVAGLLASKDISVFGSMAFEAAVVFVLVCSTISRLLRVADANPEKMDASIDHLAHHPHRKSWWKGVILLGSLCFVAYMAEGAVADWSSIFMREVRGAASGPAVAAFVAFSACMTIGRLMGDVLTMRLGKILLIRAGAFLASIGIVFGLFVPNTFATIVGFAFVGVGLSIIVPVLFSIAGSMSGGESNAAVTRVSTIAYFGLLVGPSAIGFIADHISLTWALLIPAILLIYVFVASNLLHRVVKKAGIV